MNTARKSIHDADALLLYQVGPVYCCSPTFPVEAVIMPPRLTHPPGTTSSMPGVFKYSSGIVHVVDLRKRFGVDDEDRIEPGRIVVVEVEGGHAGIWVDEIIDVIQFPSQGWGQVPVHIPRNVFTRTLLYDKKIILYADFEKLHKFRETGYLRQHIEMLKKDIAQKQVAEDEGIKKTSLIKQPVISESSTDKPIENIDVGTEEQKISDQVEKKPGTLFQNSELSYNNNKRARSEPVDSKVTQEKAKAKAVQAETKTHQPAEVQASDLHKTFLGKTSNELTSKIPRRGDMDIHKPRDISSIHPVSMTTTEEESHTYTSDVATDKLFSTHNNAQTALASENNIVLWGFGLVIVVMLSVLFYNSDKLFPDDVSKQVGVDFVVQEQTAYDSVDGIAISQADNPVLENAVVTTYPEEVSQDVDATQDLSPYRADIQKEKNEIVIVLQQPEDAVDVLIPSTNDESNVVTGVSLDEVQKFVDDKQNDEPQRTEENNLANDKKDMSHSNEELKNSIPVKDAVAARGNKLILVETKQAASQSLSVRKQVVHVVVKGDTLWHIAKRYIKDPFKYPELARLSKIKNPDLIYPGNKVIIIIENKKH